MRKLLQKLLRFFSKSVLKKYKPVIIAVTGSVGKTSTKEAIFHVLKTHFGEKEVRRNQRNYNNEIGVPLTIFGLETGGSSVFLWFFKFMKIFWMTIFRTEYPSFLVLEMGADRPGDIEYLVNFVKPKVGVITALGEIPVHVEFFENPQQVAKEKRNLISSLNENGIAILNYDDEAVRQMAEGIQAKVFTYGLKDKADVRATNYDLKVNANGNVSELNFKLEFGGSSVPARLVNVLGVQHLYSALAAAGVGITFNMNLVEIVEALKEFQPLPGRMHLIKGIKNTLIVDDTYNAAMLSMDAALESLKIFENRKKIVVLGDMLEIGEYAPEAHKRIGGKASEIADMIFTVGSRAKFIAEEAIKQGFPENRIFQFMVSDDAAIKVQEEIKENDVILIKGSRAMKMERVVKEIMAEPEKAEELLVG
jgi:UDP-N-acetylmuramoyl-tripeptide--D-alanyl-D-alanine ligase